MEFGYVLLIGYRMLVHVEYHIFDYMSAELYYEVICLYLMRCLLTLTLNKTLLGSFDEDFALFPTSPLKDSVATKRFGQKYIQYVWIRSVSILRARSYHSKCRVNDYVGVVRPWDRCSYESKYHSLSIYHAISVQTVPEEAS
jgi:hypothetical protein